VQSEQVDYGEHEGHLGMFIYMGKKIKMGLGGCDMNKEDTRRARSNPPDEEEWTLHLGVRRYDWTWGDDASRKDPPDAREMLARTLVQLGAVEAANFFPFRTGGVRQLQTIEFSEKTCRIGQTVSLFGAVFHPTVKKAST
jgi:hypothetical protein